MNKIYIYLAQRNKKGIKVLCVLLNKTEYPAMKITEVSKIGLDADMQAKIAEAVYENRMFWDLWMESAQSYADLKQSLKKRGYYEIPLFSSPSFQVEHMVLTNSESANKKTDLTIKPVIKEIKTMVRRMKER